MSALEVRKASEKKRPRVTALTVFLIPWSETPELHRIDGTSDHSTTGWLLLSILVI